MNRYITPRANCNCVAVAHQANDHTIQPLAYALSVVSRRARISAAHAAVVLELSGLLKGVRA